MQQIGRCIIALSAAVDWEVRQDGSDLNGGGWKRTAGTTDYSQQAAAQKSGADLTMHALNDDKVNPVAAGVAAADVGNVIQIESGTGWTPGFYEIIAQDGTYWWLDRSPSAAGNANLATYKMGGALASLGKAGSVPMIKGRTFYVKYSATPYVISSATPNTSGGPFSVTIGYASQPQPVIVGYDTIRTISSMDANRPTFKVADTGVSTITVLNGTSYNQAFRNFIVDGNNKTAIRGISFTGQDAQIVNCEAINCTNTGMILATIARGLKCKASNCDVGFGNGSWFACHADNCTTGFYQTRTVNVCCLATGCDQGFYQLSYGCLNIDCVAYGCTSDGFDDAVSRVVSVNCISESNGGWGFSVWQGESLFWNCAAYNNTSGAFQGGVQLNCVTITAGSVFTNAAAGDFTLNNTANQGALLRATGFPGTFVNGNVGYADIGLLQHAYPTLPAAGDVELGSGQYGYAGSLLTPNFYKPTAAQVENGVGFGSAGTEFTGTLSPGGVPQTLHSIEVGIAA